MLLQNLDAEEVCEDMIICTLRIIAEELEITQYEYVQFTKEITDPDV